MLGASVPYHFLQVGDDGLFPALTLDTKKKALLVLSAGVHGKEAAIGEAVINQIIEKHGTKLIELLKKVDIMIVPCVNPEGKRRNTRSLPNKVDLMRAALFRVKEGSPKLFGGHRGHSLKHVLPYYTGHGNRSIMREMYGLLDDVVSKAGIYDQVCIVDVHSGMGSDGPDLWAPRLDVHERSNQIIRKYTKLDFYKKNHAIVDQLKDHGVEFGKPSYRAHGDMADYLAYVSNILVFTLEISPRLRLNNKKGIQSALEYITSVLMKMPRRGLQATVSALFDVLFDPHDEEIMEKIANDKSRQIVRFLEQLVEVMTSNEDSS